MKYKVVGLRVADALRKEGKGTVQACRQTESLVGISERSVYIVGSNMQIR